MDGRLGPPLVSQLLVMGKWGPFLFHAIKENISRSRPPFCLVFPKVVCFFLHSSAGLLRGASLRSTLGCFFTAPPLPPLRGSSLFCLLNKDSKTRLFAPPVARAWMVRLGLSGWCQQSLPSTNHGCLGWSHPCPHVERGFLPSALLNFLPLSSSWRLVNLP